MELNSYNVPLISVTWTSLTKRPLSEMTKPRSGSDGSVYTNRLWVLAENLGVRSPWVPAFSRTRTRLSVLTADQQAQSQERRDADPVNDRARHGTSFMRSGPDRSGGIASMRRLTCTDAPGVYPFSICAPSTWTTR